MSKAESITELRNIAYGLVNDFNSFNKWTNDVLNRNIVAELNITEEEKQSLSGALKTMTSIVTRTKNIDIREKK